jgi:AcrR family transcriptional regulator
MVDSIGKRQLQKAATKELILRSARKMYSNQGFSVSANAIAQEAGVAHGTIFVHFPSREVLQFQTLEQFASELGNKLHNLANAGENIKELLYAHISILEDYEPFYKNLLMELHALPQDTQMILVSLQSIISLHFGTAIALGQKAGTIKDIPSYMLFNTWIALLHYYLQNSGQFAPGKSVLKQRKKELVDSFYALISK